MENIAKIHNDKSPNRIHYIAEWADRRQMTQADIMRETGFSKGAISKWFDGELPQTSSLEILRQVFALDEINQLFRHPDDDWMMRLFRKSDPDQMKALRALIEATFQLKVG